MARLIIDKNRQDFLEQLESLRESYASFDKKKNKTPIQIAALAESEEEFVKEGPVPKREIFSGEITGCKIHEKMV